MQKEKPYREGWTALLCRHGLATHGKYNGKGGEAKRAALFAKIGYRPPPYFTDRDSAEKFADDYRRIVAPPPKREELKESQQAKVDRAIAHETARLMRDFEEEVHKAALKETAEHRRVLDELEAKARKTEKTYSELLESSELGVVSRDEFQLIRSCLHPDREADPARKAKAFDLFNRLESRLVRRK